MSSFDWGATLPTLPGERLDLRAVREADAPALLAIFGDAEVTRFWSSPPLADVDAARALARQIDESFRARRLFQWGIASRADGALIGTCTIFNLDEAHRRAEIGFALRRDLWGRGLASEALRVLLRFCFETLQLHRLEADVDPHNERSLRALERQGFRREGYLRERWHQSGEIHDAVFLGLLHGEWTR